MEAAKQRVDRDQVSRRKKGMWRWHELLPVLEEENQIFLGEGDTPLLSLPRLQKDLVSSTVIATALVLIFINCTNKPRS